MDAELEALQLEDEPPPTLLTLPIELQFLVLTKVDAQSLVAVADTCRSWRDAHNNLARSKLNGVIGSSCGDECQTPLRALYNYDRLAAAVGTPPADRYWQSEWPDLRIRQALLLAQSRGPDRAARFVEQINSIGHEEMRRAFLPGGDHSIDNDLQGTYRLSVAWKVSNGWEEEEAEAASLLCSLGSAALADCLFQGVEPGAAHAPFVSSTWRLCSILWQRSWRIHSSALPSQQPSPSPACYAHLDGEFGLRAEDPAWSALNQPWPANSSGEYDPVSFVTRGFPCAMEANANSFPFDLDNVFHMPVNNRGGEVTYEPVESDLVCFVEGSPLIPTDEAIYRLPPFARVTLLHIKEPKEWSVAYRLPGEHVAHRVIVRCYVVGVEF